ncbi:MAG: hypothetical protein ACM3NR_02985 [Methanosarcina sp.]
MKNNPSSAEELKAIRQIMEDSTKFLSISGFSGVIMGSFAIIGAAIAWYLILDKGSIGLESAAARLQIIIVASLVLLLSVAAAFYFSLKKARKSGKNFWTSVTKRLFLNLFIPLIAGGVFAIILLSQNQYQLIVPVLLIFYGLALINAGKFTYNEIFYIGILEIITGLLSALLSAHALIFWIVGFGILHIVYGLFMFRKYEL